MIIYPNKDVPRTLTLEEATRIIIHAKEIPVGVLNTKLEELDVSSSLSRLFARHEMEYVGECNQSIINKLGFGTRALIEISQLINYLIYEYNLSVEENFFALAR